MPRNNKARAALSSTKDAALAILSLAKETTDLFPPLKAAVACALFIAETVDTFKSNKKEWRELALYLASTISELATTLSSHNKVSASLERDVEAFASELKTLQDTISALASRSLLDRISQAKGDPAKISAFRIQIISAMTRFTAISAISLRQGQDAVAAAVVSPMEPDFTVLTPAKPTIFHGRDEELSSILSSIKKGLEVGKPARIAIRGSGGLGKTTLVLSILYHEESKVNFGEQVYFVSCESSHTPSLLITAINRTLKIPRSDADPLVQLRGFLQLRSQPTFLVLDNFETAWLIDDQESVRQILALLDSTLLLTVVLTTRVTVLPQGIQWTKPILPVLRPISLEAAKATFHDIAGEGDPPNSTSSSSELETLLSLVDMVPLAVTLMASAAQSGESVSSLRRAWIKERTLMLADGSANKSTNIEVSIKISLDSKPIRDNPLALRLLSLICLLPDGAERSKLEEITSIPNPDPGIRALKSISLMYEEHNRLKILSPIRGYIFSKEEFRPHAEDRAAVIQSYTTLALKADCWIDDEKFLRTREELEPEAGNLYSILSLAIADNSPSPEFANAIFIYTRFLTLTGPSADLLEQLINRKNWDEHLEAELKAKLLSYFGIVYTNMEQFEKAIAQSERSRKFALEQGVAFQAAYDLRNIGDAYRRMGEHEKSLAAFNAAKKEMDALDTEQGAKISYDCSEQIGTVLVSMGRWKEVVEHQEQVLVDIQADFPREASRISHILQNLATAHSSLGNYELASAYAEESYSQFKEAGYLRGQGNTLWVLGITLLKADDCEGAVELLQESIRILTLIGDLTMVSLAYVTLGMAWGKLKKLDNTRDAFSHAMSIYKGQGKLKEQAGCLYDLGTTLCQWDDPECITYFQQAREMFLKLGLKLSAAKALSSEGTAKLRCRLATQSELLQIFNQARAEFYDAGDKLEAAWTCFFEGSALHILGDYAKAERAYRVAVEGFQESGDEKLAEIAQKCLENALALFKTSAESIAAESVESTQEVEDTVTRLTQLEISHPGG